MPSSHDTPDLHQRDPHPTGPSRFKGRRISFDHNVNGRVARLVGVVEQAEFNGYTQRGKIPDYTLTVRGQSGAVVKVSLVESYASFPDL